MGLESTLYNVGYPVYGARFLNNSTLLVTGGGGEGNNGIPNKLTALQVNFQKKKIVKRFRELTLDDNEDSPTTLDVAQDVILMGCNENSEKIRSGGPNHHLRKFVYENEHLKFVGAIDLNRSTDPEDYTKLLYMSQDGSVAAIASSVVPTVIRIVNPSNLRETYEVETGNDVKDLHFSSDGKVLAYITSSTLEVISIVTGNFIVRKTDFEKNLSLSKIRFVGENTILIAASLKKDAGIVLTKISLKKGNTSILKTKLVTKKFKSVTSMDVDPKGQLVALAGSDNSVAIVKLKSFTVGKFFKQIHTFAVTRVAFSPDSRLLVSASAANTIHLVQIPDDFATKTSMLEKLCKFLINFVLVALLALLVQISFKHGLPSKTYNIIRKHIISKDNKTPNSLFNDIFLPQTTLVGDVVTVLPSTKSLNTESASFPTDQWVNEAGSHVVDNSYPTSELKEGIVEKYYSGITELDLSMPRSEDLTKEAGQDSLVTDDSTDDKGYEHILSEDNVISRDESVLSGDTFETATSSVHEERSSVQKASIPSYIDSTSQFSGIVDNEKASYSSPGNIVEKIYVLDTEEGTTISESSDASLNDASTGDLEEYLYDPINDIFETSPCSSVNYDASGVDVPNEQTSELSIERHSSSTGISSSKSNILDHPRIGPLQSAISALVNNVGPRKKDESSKSHSITEESNPTGLDDKTENFRSKSSSGLLQDMEDEIIHPRSVLNSFRSLNMKLNEKTSLESSRTLSTTKPSARTSSKSYSKVYSEVDPETDKKSSPAAEEPSISTGLPDLMVTMPTSALVSTNTKDTEVEDSRLIMSESLDTIDCDSSNCPTSSFDKTAERQESSINSDKSTAGFGKEINVSTYTAPPIYRTMSDSDKKNIASPSAASQSSGSNVEIVTVKEIVKETVFVTEKLVETTAPGNKHDEL